MISKKEIQTLDILKTTLSKKIAEDICSVQPMNNIDFAAMCDEDHGVDVTWMMIHGYKKVVKPFGHHGLFKTVHWVKKEE